MTDSADIELLPCPFCGSTSLTFQIDLTRRNLTNDLDIHNNNVLATQHVYARNTYGISATLS